MSEGYWARAGAHADPESHAGVSEETPADGEEPVAAPQEPTDRNVSGTGGDEEPGEAEVTEIPVTDTSPDEEPAGAEGPGSQLSSLVAERDEYLDALRRVQADFENYRKRVLRQQTELLERAALELVGKLLPVLDIIDLALAHSVGEDPSADGLTKVAATAKEVLSREGLERLDPAGQQFDPVLHEAVAHEGEALEQDKPMVSEVLRPGYRWKGQLVRPAMVKVTG